ncbi:MAG: hypothetical protein Q8Q13_02265 [bacterium]|nr:hypothetical protein [bacterium]
MVGFVSKWERELQESEEKMSKQTPEERRMEYRREIGGQYGRKHSQKIFQMEDELAGRPDGGRIYQEVGNALMLDIAAMTDETLGRVVATIPEWWGRRTIALLKLDYQLEKPAEKVVGREFMMCLAKCAIFGAIMDYLAGKSG